MLVVVEEQPITSAALVALEVAALLLRQQALELLALQIPEAVEALPQQMAVQA